MLQKIEKFDLSEYFCMPGSNMAIKNSTIAIEVKASSQKEKKSIQDAGGICFKAVIDQIEVKASSQKEKKSIQDAGRSCISVW